MKTDSFDVGEMFWGKSQSYPWWPCVIVNDNNNENKRYRKKIGTQFHVQFINSHYDDCWITDQFLIRYEGKAKFEQYVEQQIVSSDPEVRQMFDMKMQGDVHVLWVKACLDAERFYLLRTKDRVKQLPKYVTEELSTVKKAPKLSQKKQRKRHFCKVSSINCYSSSDTESTSETKDTETRKYRVKSSSTESDEICKNTYKLNKNTDRMTKSSNKFQSNKVEKAASTQSDISDNDAKLLYLNGQREVPISVKSRISGRKIKVPSRLRQNSVDEPVKRTNPKKKQESSSDKKSVSENSTVTTLDDSTDAHQKSSDNTEMTEDSVKHSLNSYKEALDLECLEFAEEDMLMEIMKIIVNRKIPKIMRSCFHCFKPFETSKTVSCNGGCTSVFHLNCVVNFKLVRTDDNPRCINCLQKDKICCICRNFKYMKKQFLVKCQKEHCTHYFHPTCLKFLTSIENPIDENEFIYCPNHFCLTCVREDPRHPCNRVGPFVKCAKCPVSYHADLICIPAGGRFLTKDRIVCYRHLDNNVPLDLSVLTRCFVCFNDNATLKCCRCRSVYHPKCLQMPTYTDLLKDYICQSCKLETPMFHGQIVWKEYGGVWIPAEIVSPHHTPVDRLSSNVRVRIFGNNDICSTTCRELLPFITGMRVLQDVVNRNSRLVKNAFKMHFVYLNWRKRVVPYAGLTEILSLMEMLCVSLKNFCCNDVETFKYIDSNISDGIDFKKFLPPSNPFMCSCSTTGAMCLSNVCSNYLNKVECDASNCSLKDCENRQFSKGFPLKPAIIFDSSVAGYGVKIAHKAKENTIIGEIIGRFLSTDDVWKLFFRRGNLESVSYVFHVVGDLFINAEDNGNDWRYINHSCEPNCQLVCWIVSGQPRLGIVTKRSIDNEEITLDYKHSVALKYGFICKCNSSLCSIVVGPTSLFLEQPDYVVPTCCCDEEKSIVLSPKKSIEIPSRILTKPSVNNNCNLIVSSNSMDCDSVIDDRIVCFRCNGTGELISCDKSGCSKRFHIQCIETPTAFSRLWFCPSHFCRECGKASSSNCQNCSASFCSYHEYLHQLHECVSRYNNNFSSNYGIYPLTKDAGFNNLTSSVIKQKYSTKRSYSDEFGKIESDHYQSKKVKKSMSYQSNLIEQTNEVVVKTEKVASMDIISVMEKFSLSKEDIYEACGLVKQPETVNKESLSNMQNSGEGGKGNSPSHLPYKQQSVTPPDTESTEHILPVSIATTSYDDYDYDILKSSDDYLSVCSDARFEIVPTGIRELENLISSPTLLDE